MVDRQAQLYRKMVQDYKDRAAKVAAGEGDKLESGIGMLMNLRKLANHPLLVRDHYSDDQLAVIARTLKVSGIVKENSHMKRCNFISNINFFLLIPIPHIALVLPTIATAILITLSCM